jgi:hypothetical protein
MKTPIQELIEQLKEERDGFMNLPPYSNIQERTANCFGSCIEIAERMLEKEKEFVTNFAMDYVSSGNVGCAIWADGPPELDIEKNARDYYKEYINTTSLDSTEWSNTKEK